MSVTGSHAERPDVGVKGKVLYICGIGHNGSTTLNLVLGQSPGIFETSQFNDFLVFYEPENDENARRRLFWTGVKSSIPTPGVEAVRAAHVYFLDERHFLRLALSRARRRKAAGGVDALLSSLFSRIEQGVIIDSSKNVSRGLALTQSAFDVAFLHLTRHPLSFVNSVNKRRREKHKSALFFRPLMWWFLKNISTRVFIAPRARKFLHLRYEDFQADPDSALREIERLLDIDLSGCAPYVSGERNIEPTNSMGFGGNRVLRLGKPFRFERSTESSHDAFASWQRRWAKLLGAPWGYA